jgi:O-antigen ligase
MFDPNDLAYFSLVFMPLNLIFVGRNNSFLIRVVCLCSFVTCVMVVLLSGSRGGFLAMALVFLILLFSKNSMRLLLKIFIVVASFVVLTTAPINIDRFSTILSIEEDYNVQSESGRLAIWGIGIRTMFANPLTGVGIKNFNAAVGLDREARGAEILAWQSPHNSLVQIGAETGLVGLFLYLLVSLNVLRIFCKVKRLSKQKDIKLFVEMGIVGFVGMFTSAFFLTQAYSIYWVFYVVISAVVNRLFESQQPELDVMVES